MKTRTNVKARAGSKYLLAVVVALVMAMCLAVPAAFAADGKITINSVSGNTAQTYDAYQVFAADVVIGTDGKDQATGVVWGGADTTEQGKVEQAVKAAIAAYAAAKAGDPGAPNIAADAAKVASGSAQDAADFISKYQTGDADLATTQAAVYYSAEEAATEAARAEAANEEPMFVEGDLKTPGTYTFATDKRLANASLANLIAQQLQAKGVAKKATFGAGTAQTLPEGYYLFNTTPSTLGTGEMGTSPIYQLINDEREITVTEKTKVPTVNKEVKEDGKGVDYTHDTNLDPAQDKVYVKLAGSNPAAYQLLDASVPDFGAEGYTAYEHTQSGYTYYKEVPVDKWGKVADANIGQAMDYRLTGTLPDNLATFSSYYYEFTDTMSAGITLLKQDGTTEVAVDGLAKDDVIVKIDGTRVANNSFNATYTAETAGSPAEATGKTILSVEFNPVKNDDGTSASGDTDLLIAKDTSGNAIPVTKDSVITVEYKAKLNTNCIIAGAGNPNTVDLEYSNNPNQTSKGKTVEVENRLYAFKLDLEKVRKGEESTKLSGAKFTIQVKDPATDSNGGKYVQADGSLGNTAYEFTTDANGMLGVSGLDAQTYIIHETVPPAGYDAMDADIEFTIAAEYGTNPAEPLNLGTLTATMSGGNNDATAADKDTTTGYLLANGKGTGIKQVSAGEKTIDAAGKTVTAGNVSLKVTNEQRITMPLTGLDGITFTYILGGIILAVSVFALLRRKMSNRVQEDVA